MSENNDVSPEPKTAVVNFWTSEYTLPIRLARLPDENRLKNVAGSDSTREKIAASVTTSAFVVMLAVTRLRQMVVSKPHTVAPSSSAATGPISPN